MASSGWQGAQYISTIGTYSGRNVDYYSDINITSIVHSGTTLYVSGQISGYSSYVYGLYYNPIYVTPSGGSQIEMFASSERITTTAKTVSFTATISGVAASTTSYSFGVRYYCQSNFDTTKYWTLSFDPSYTAPTTPTISGSASAFNTVTVTYGTSSFGNPSTGTVYLYGASNSTPSTVVAQSSSTGDNVYTNTSLVGNTTYYYRSNAVNSQATSGYSTEITITTPCPALATLEVTNITETTATLSYSQAADGGAISSKTLQYRLNSDAWQDLGTASSIGTFTISGLTEGTSYTLEVRLVTTAGNGAIKSVTITSGVPSRFYGSVNGEAKKVKKLYGSVNGQAKRIVKLYGSVNGQAKRVI